MSILYYLVNFHITPLVIPHPIFHVSSPLYPHKISLTLSSTDIPNLVVVWYRVVVIGKIMSKDGFISPTLNNLLEFQRPRYYKIVFLQDTIVMI